MNDGVHVDLLDKVDFSLPEKVVYPWRLPWIILSRLSAAIQVVSARHPLLIAIDYC